MSSILPPLDAVISRRNGAYLVEVAGVEVATCDDIVAATNRLCSEAAKYRRRVFVTVAAKHGQHHLEIDEDGVIGRTTAPATGAASLPTTTTRPVLGPRPGGSPAHHSPVPDAVLVGARAAHPVAGSGISSGSEGGVPSRTTVTGAGREHGTLSWRLGSHRSALLIAGALLVAVVVTVVVSLSNLAAAERDAADAAAWQAVRPASAAQVDELRGQLGGRADVEASLTRAAARFGLRVVGMESTSAPLTWDTPLGEVPDAGARWTFTVTGPRVGDYLAAVADSPAGVQVERVVRDANSAQLTVRVAAVQTTAP